MPTRHSQERRQQFAVQAGEIGDAAVAERAGVEVDTVRKWRQEFGVQATQVAAVPSVSHLDLHDLVPAEDEGHSMVVATRALNDYEPTDGDPAHWCQSRSEYLHHFAEYLKPDTHPAMGRFHARRMALAADSMMGEGPDEMEDVCAELANEAEGELEAADYAASSAEDDDLPDPTTYPQRPDASYDDFEDHGEYPDEIAELRAMAEVLAQDAIAEGESDQWREARDEFLRYLEAYAKPDIHPAMAKHYAWRLVLCGSSLSQHSGPEGDHLYGRMDKTLESENQAAQYDLDSMD